MSRHLMARFRHFAAEERGLDFDWKPHPFTPNGFSAQLENGDRLQVRPFFERWSYTLLGPKNTRIKGIYQYHKAAAEKDIWPVLAYKDSAHDDLTETMRIAEQHYKSLGRTGITPSHGQDYDIDQIMRKFDGGEL